MGTENIFKPTIGNESLHQDSKENGVRIVNITTSKYLVVGALCSVTRIHKYILTSPDRKTHNQTDHILIYRRSHSSILDVRSSRGADSDTDHYLVVAKFRGKLAVSKQRKI